MSVMEPGIKPDEMELREEDVADLGDVIRDRHLENVTPSSEAPVEMTAEDKAGIERMNESASGVQPEVSENPVKDSKILDLRDTGRADNTARAQQRLAQLQEMEGAGEHTVTAGALDRQAERTTTEGQDDTPPVVAPKKQKGFIGQELDKLGAAINKLRGKE